MNTILIIDHVRCSGESIQTWIENEGQVDVMLVHSIAQALEKLKVHSIDLFIYIGHKSLSEEVKCIQLLPQIPILYIGIINGYPALDRLLHNGVTAILKQESSPEQILRAVHSVLNGMAVLPVHLLHQLHHREGMKDYVLLNRKERSILEWIAEGKSNKELATIFCVSQRTIEYYLTNIYNKFKVSSRCEAVIAAKDRGIINV
ncbi:helix-turn-helix transcriptional regulator [Paenibacillus sp. FSL W8-0439]|uniref:helix-turn-helix transcriptional regulator n=1 Tax=Paenibacillus sp. FSL W8-0439 TaxID=2921716 RepID=UPI0030F65BED